MTAPKVYTVNLRVNESILSYQIHDDLVVNYNDYKSSEHAYLLHDAGFPICIVFADNESDALDIAYDNSKLESYIITEEDEETYKKDGIEDVIQYLGNNEMPCDVESIDIVELPKPKQLSYCATLTGGLSCTGGQR